MVKAIVLAGGKGKRMQSEVFKQYLLLDGKPLIFYALKAFEQSPVDEVVLVVVPGEEERVQKEIVTAYGLSKVKKVIAGGCERFESVYLGLCAAGTPELVLIHDGARPLITPELISLMIKETREKKACVAGVPVKDTIQMTDTEGVIVSTPERKSLYTAQTPQSFLFPLVFRAYQKLIASKATDVTDDAMVVSRYEKARVHIVSGSYRNIKVTTPEDLIIAEAFLRATSVQKTEDL